MSSINSSTKTKLLELSKKRKFIQNKKNKKYRQYKSENSRLIKQQELKKVSFGNNITTTTRSKNLGMSRE